ncbi:bacillithiol system redox-active protein YtxJ [Lysinibacillus sp. KU-BSD001]|uniref:bacillithiol system redox-active protein YtxJ n=1 Tax=Lysinibacillus sp. KU-BSD001 TaxID=3141328 RepID=UPI0036E804AE
MNYTEIVDINQWQHILATSNEQPIVVFKHSTTCPISAAAYREFTSVELADAYLVKVIEHRDVSNEIAKDLQVQHASPQAIIIQNGQAVWQATHYKITANALKEALV